MITIGRIPRRYFWLFDALVVGAAFFTASFCFPYLHCAMMRNGLNELWLVQCFSPPGFFNTETMSINELSWMLLVMIPAVILFMELVDGYCPLINQSYTRLVLHSLIASLVGFGSISGVLFALKDSQPSRMHVLLFIVFCLLGLSIYRVIMRTYFLRRKAVGRYARNLALVGTASGIQSLLRHMNGLVSSTEYRLIGYVPLPARKEFHNELESLKDVNLSESIGRTEMLGGIDGLGEVLVHKPIEEVIIVYPRSGGGWLRDAIRDCEDFRVTLRIVPEVMLSEERRITRSLYRFDELMMPTITLRPPHFNSEAIYLKRLLDVIVSATLLIALAPLFGLIAVAIKITTPHLPVFYPWRVVGKNGVRFTGYKFTTMNEDADERKVDLMTLNEMTGPVFKIKNDPRITPLGRFLRKYSLNELPQLWSVLIGDMSLVGPRPAFLHELVGYEFWHKRKLSIQPGITCLWQINGRNKINNFDEWVKLDLEYIDKWCLWLDFKILFRTLLTVISGTGS